MLDFGFSEILLTSAIALIVLGPEKLPKVARQVGNWMGRARVMARQLSEQLEREVTAEELLRAQDSPPRRDASSAEARDVTHGPVIAPAWAPTPPPASLAAAEGTPEAAAASDPPGLPEPVYGLPASQTTAAAMHAADVPPTDANPAYQDPPPP